MLNEIEKFFIGALIGGSLAIIYVGNRWETAVTSQQPFSVSSENFLCKKLNQ